MSEWRLLTSQARITNNATAKEAANYNSNVLIAPDTNCAACHDVVLKQTEIIECMQATCTCTASTSFYIAKKRNDYLYHANFVKIDTHTHTHTSSIKS